MFIKDKVSIKLGFVIVLSVLLFVSLFNPITVGYNTNKKFTRLNENQNMHNNSYDRYALLDPYSPEVNIPEQNEIETSSDNIDTSGSLQLNKQKEEPTLTEVSNNPPLDSPWPMYCHDVRHTGRSPYNTVNNLGLEKWRLELIEDAKGSPVIDDNGDIYIGATHLYAVHPNGTLKWEYDDWLEIESAPAIDEKGVLYVGTIWAMPNYLYAIYTSNGTLKWKFKIGDDIYSSPAIGEDGSIYFGSETDYIYALYPNGTLKWKYKTSVAVLSSPAIGEDGTVYCGSHDKHLYALYPNNGTLKWKYKTGHWIRTSPCIADDGTIYVVSLDDHLHAVYPNGTLKWKTNVGAGTSPTIGQDGTIYCGYDKLHAVNPTNGSIKWKLPIGGKIRGATPCNSIDGTIYLGDSDGSDIVAVNPDGTEKWRRAIGGDVESAPAIGEDGTIYIGSRHNMYGYLHAFGPLDPNAPTAPVITGQTSGTAGKEYEYTFKSTSPLGRDVYYHIEWGDGNIKDFFGPYNSGEEIIVNHTFSKKGTYTIRAYARDTENLRGPWGEFKITMLKNKATYNSFFLQFLERFSLLKQLFSS